MCEKRPGYRRISTAAACAGIALGAVVLSAPGSQAMPGSTSGFHGYGVIGITSADLTGISEYRYDEAVRLPGGTHCRTPYSSLPVYQTEWLIDKSGNWLEIGTGHQCEGYQYWYAGFGTSNGLWDSLWTKSVSNDSGHRFWIQGTIALNEKYFTYNIGTIQRAHMFFDFSGSFDQTGLESYSAKATVPAYEMKSLEFSTDYNVSWSSWTHTKLLPPVHQPVCILLRSATEAVAGENVTCQAATAADEPVPHVRATASKVTAGSAGKRAQPGGGRNASGAATDASGSACRHAASTWRARGVIHSYESTAGAVQVWRETRLTQARPVFPPLSRTAAASPVAVCYLSGTFTGIPSPPGTHTAYRELSVMVNEVTGASALDAASRSRSWPYGPPPRS
jgi:hypothetical protein